jgi:alanine racemase
MLLTAARARAAVSFCVRGSIPRALLRHWRRSSVAGQMRATRVTVDLDQLRHNFRVVRRLVAPASVLAVVKANAYGHGLVECAEIFRQEGAAMLGVAFVEEAIQLRQAGNPLPILVLTPPQAEEAALFCAFGVHALASSREVMEQFAAEARRRGAVVPVHIMVDTGMHREGIAPHQVLDFARWLFEQEGLQPVGIATHFATADEADPAFLWEQLRQFRAVLEQLEAAGMHFPFVHAANSAALVRFPESRFTLVRPGIVLYGYQPWQGGERLPVHPALQWRSRVVEVRRIAAGESVSYHRLYRAQRDTTIATVPVGYADGYTRRLSGRAECLIGGRRFPIVGAICMDELLVDVGDAPVQPGEEVVLLGQQGQESIWAEELACWAESIPYEVLTAIGSRVPRVYCQEEQADAAQLVHGAVAGV